MAIIWLEETLFSREIDMFETLRCLAWFFATSSIHAESFLATFYFEPRGGFNYVCGAFHMRLLCFHG